MCNVEFVDTCEHPTNPSFPNFFVALYFVLTTLTTVGFGDIVPITTEGRLWVAPAGLFSRIVACMVQFIPNAYI